MLFYVPVDAAHMMGPLDVFFQLMSRYETHRNVGFDSAAGDDRTVFLNRGRLGFDWKQGEDANIRVSFQYSSINTKDEGTGFPGFVPTGDFVERKRQDLNEAYIEKKNGENDSFRIGRQSISRDWLVGAQEWGEVGRSWDGISVMHGPCDFFVGQLDLDSGSVAGFGSSQKLAYAGHNWGRWGKTSIYYKSDDTAADSLYTLGHSYEHEGGNVEWMLNGALQWGRQGGVDQNAWAGIAGAHLGLGSRLSAWAHYATASGGTTSAGHSRTFDELYPNDHGRFGLMDLQALSNVQTFGVGLSLELSKDMGLMAGYHSFKLFDAEDAWYNTSLGLNYVGAVDPSGLSGTDVGNEMDVAFHWMASDHFNVSAGFGVFNPGSFLQNVGFGSDNQTFFYAKLGLKY